MPPAGPASAGPSPLAAAAAARARRKARRRRAGDFLGSPEPGDGPRWSFGCEHAAFPEVEHGELSRGPGTDPDPRAGIAVGASPTSNCAHGAIAEAHEGLSDHYPLPGGAGEAIKDSPFYAFKDRRRFMSRPASVDLGCHGTETAGMFAGGSQGAMSRSSDAFPSPGTPRYHRHGGAAGMGSQKGWSSERVPLSSQNGGRYVKSSLGPVGKGRVLPSKWEDAERWIFSPSFFDNAGRVALAQPRRPKSKSGPLGPTPKFTGPYSSNMSVALVESGRMESSGVSSPFLMGVLMPDRVCTASVQNGGDETESAVSSNGRGRPYFTNGTDSAVSSNGRGGRSYLANEEPRMAPSLRRSGWLDTPLESSSSIASSWESMLDEKADTMKEVSNGDSPAVSRKHVGTQTSPERSIPSSPKMRPSFSCSLSSQQMKELESCLSKLETRDVPVDSQVTVDRRLRKHVIRAAEMNLKNIVEGKKNEREFDPFSVEVTESARCILKFDAKETSLAKWEFLQRTKSDAAAALQDLEVDLEKKRPSSLEKIFNALRAAQKIARSKRTTVSKMSEDPGISTTPRKSSHLKKEAQISSLSGCFTCHAF